MKSISRKELNWRAQFAPETLTESVTFAGRSLKFVGRAWATQGPAQPTDLVLTESEWTPPEPQSGGFEVIAGGLSALHSAHL